MVLGAPGPHSDLWAFGCVMVEMASGAPPWAGMRPMEILMQVAVKRRTPPIPDGLPHALAAGLLERCFVHEPARLAPGAGAIPAPARCIPSAVLPHKAHRAASE